MTLVAVFRGGEQAARTTFLTSRRGPAVVRSQDLLAAAELSAGAKRDVPFLD